MLFLFGVSSFEWDWTMRGDGGRGGESKPQKENPVRCVLAWLISSAPSLQFICKHRCSISSSSARAVTFAVPLWILNADISAHISDDWGIFMQNINVSGSPPAPKKRMWLFRRASAAHITAWVTHAEIWACMMCSWCVRVSASFTVVPDDLFYWWEAVSDSKSPNEKNVSVLVI